MKSFVVPISVIVGLIIFFVIFDHKEFNRYDDVPTGQSESSTINRKLSMTVSQMKPVTEVKPASDKPFDGTPVAEVKPTTHLNPTEIKPTAEKKPMIVPAAVAVVTPEEAEKHNEFALFLLKVKMTVVEGEITERSELPDPKNSDYPNCRYTAHFNGNSIQSGEPCPKETALIIEGFENYRTLETDKLKTGDKVQCNIIPFECLPEEYQSTQQADDLNLFLLENYYVVNIRNIDSYSDDPFTPKSGIFFSDGNADYISIFDRHINPPIPQVVVDAQKASIQNDLQKMNKLLDGYDDEKIKDINKQFAAAWKKEKEKDSNGYNRVGDYVWRNIDNSFWSLPVNYSFLSKPALLTQKTLDSFLALKDVCEANGTQLLISLVPHYTDISARILNKKFRDIPDLQTATFVKQLSEIGVETIYSSDAIIKDFNRFPFAFFFPKNVHPSDTTQDIISDILAERLRRYNILPTLDPLLFTVRQNTHVYRNEDAYLFPKNCDIGDNEPGTTYTCREVLYDNKLIPRTNDAPIIILGNSFLQTPMADPDTLPTLISMKLLTPIDFLRVESSGPFNTIILQILANPKRYLKDKKVLVMQFGSTSLAEANAYSLMVNIREEDENHILFNNKSTVMTYDKLLNVETGDSIDDRLWENLPQKHVYVIGESGLSDIATFSVESNLDTSANVVCMIPAVCFKEQSASLLVNGVEKSIPSFHRNPFYTTVR